MFVIFLYKNVIRKQLKRDRTQNVESYSFLLKALLLTAIPVVFSTAVYNINQIIDQVAAEEKYSPEVVKTALQIIDRQRELVAV